MESLRSLRHRAGAVLRGARLCRGRREALSREPLLFNRRARPREGAWVGPEGGPLHCGARRRNGHTPLRWGAESVCGGRAGPVVPTK